MEILSAPEFYTSVAAYVHNVDPTWAEEIFRDQLERERVMLAAALGPPNGRTVLDCACGGGGQAIPLAQLGWDVTATDLTPAYLSQAGTRAAELELAIHFQAADMRRLTDSIEPRFDAVVCCMALDNLIRPDEISQALAGMWGVLQPDGSCYIRLRDFDHLFAERPRLEFKEERCTSHGRVIRLEDWLFDGDPKVVFMYVYLSEDDRRSYPWQTDIFALQRRALRKAELAAALLRAGFEAPEFLPQPSPWHPYEVLATKPHR